MSESKTRLSEAFAVLYRESDDRSKVCWFIVEMDTEHKTKYCHVWLILRKLKHMGEVKRV